MKIKQIRNATLRINFGGVEFLTDPWLVSMMPDDGEEYIF